MGLRLEFVIHNVPMSLNEALRSHWSKNSKESKAIHAEMAYFLKRHIPKTPIKKAKVTLWRYSSGRLDRDNKFFTCKYILDNLVKLKVLENDTEESVVHIEVNQMKIKKGEPKRIVCLLEEVE